MGAVHFLEHEFSLPDYRTQGLAHDFELFEHGGERFLRLWVGGRSADMAVTCILTKAQALQIAEAADSLAARIGD